MYTPSLPEAALRFLQPSAGSSCSSHTLSEPQPRSTLGHTGGSLEETPGSFPPQTAARRTQTYTHTHTWVLHQSSHAKKLTHVYALDLF